MAQPWDLQCRGFTTDLRYRVVIDADSAIQALGSADNPVLQVGALIESHAPSEGWAPNYVPVVAWSASLHANGNDPAPIVATGYQPFFGEPLYLPMNHSLIEGITREASGRPEGEVWLWLRLNVLVSVPDAEKQKHVYLPSVVTFTTGRNIMLPVNAPRWQTYLEKWGFPSHRLIAVRASLSPSLSTKNPVAQQAWTTAIQALARAQDLWRENKMDLAAQELRGALDHALFTWAAWWGDDGPATARNVSAAINVVKGGIPGCDPDSGSWPGRSDPPDVHRLCEHFALLRQLGRLAQPTHHRGARGVYERFDVEHLITSTASALAVLPHVLEEYPRPL